MNIGKAVFSSDKINTSFGINYTNIFKVTLTKGTWILFSSLRSDSNGGRIFAEFSKSDFAVGGATSNNNDVGSVYNIGVVTLTSTTDIYARYSMETGTRNATTGGLLAILL